MKKYAEPVTFLLIFLIHVQNSTDYMIPLAGDITHKIKALQSALQSQQNISEAIHAVLSGIWLTKWKKILTNPFPCPTEHLLIILTLQSDGSHKPPSEVTGYFVKLEYCIRLTCLKEIKQITSERLNDNDEDACNQLSPWFTEHTNSPFSQLQSLQHHASSIAYQTMSFPQIWWIDTEHWSELLYKGE